MRSTARLPTAQLGHPALYKTLIVAPRFAFEAGLEAL